MATASMDFETLASQALELSSVDKLKLIRRLTTALEIEVGSVHAHTDNPMLMIVNTSPYSPEKRKS